MIFLTARDAPDGELLAFGVGGDDFIRKPYTSAIFLRPCDLLWGRRRQQGRTQPVKNNEHFYPYNNGLAEGSVNKIKVIKRTMYGRNSFELLKAKVLFYELSHVEFN